MAQALHPTPRMDQHADTGPSHIGVRPAVVVALALMVLWLGAYWRLGQVGPELIQLSRFGPRALGSYLSGHYREAAAAYRAGLAGPLRVPYVNDPSGYWALRAGHPDEAERRARTTLGLVPTAVEPLVTLGEIALGRGHVREAAKAFAAVLRRRPDHVDALYFAAVAQARVGNVGQAIDALNRALRQHSAGSRDTVLFQVMELVGDLAGRPDDGRPLCLLAHLHRYLRIFDERQGLAAIDYAERAVAADDRPADAYLTIGIVHDKRGDYTEARSAMRRAVEVDPGHAEALRWLAVEAGKTGDVLTQYQTITAAFAAAPADPFYLADLEHVMVNSLDDPLGMMRLLQRAVAADPANAEAHARLARVAGRLGDQARARRHAERFAELRSRVAGAP